MKPVIVCSKEALVDWRRLRREGIASGELHRRAANLVPQKGAHRVYAAVGRDGGRIFDPAHRWTAHFVKERTPGETTRWLITTVEANG